VIQAYPSYRLEHIYNKSFLEGGLTLGQIEALYEYHVERTLEEMRFQANIHGAKIEGDKGSSKEEDKSQTPIFKDPSAYENMTMEQRKELTEKMLTSHKKIVGGVSSDIGSR